MTFLFEPIFVWLTLDEVEEKVAVVDPRQVTDKPQLTRASLEWRELGGWFYTGTYYSHQPKCKLGPGSQKSHN